MTRQGHVAGISLLLCFCGSVWAQEFKGELLVTTNYVWRGISMSEDAPAVIGGVDFRQDPGWFGSAHVATVRVDGRPEQQVIARAGYKVHHRSWSYDAGLVHYEYTHGDRYDPATDRLVPGTANKADFGEVFVGVGYGYGEFRYYRSEDYLGKGKLGNHYDFNYAVPLSRGITGILHYGFTDSESINDHSAQLSDMALGFAKGPFSLLIANLDDHEDGLQSRNSRIVVSWHQFVEL